MESIHHRALTTDAERAIAPDDEPADLDLAVRWGVAG